MGQLEQLKQMEVSRKELVFHILLNQKVIAQQTLKEIASSTEDTQNYDLVLELATEPAVLNALVNSKMRTSNHFFELIKKCDLPEKDLVTLLEEGENTEEKVLRLLPENQKYQAFK